MNTVSKQPTWYRLAVRLDFARPLFATLVERKNLIAKCTAVLLLVCAISVTLRVIYRIDK